MNEFLEFLFGFIIAINVVYFFLFFFVFPCAAFYSEKPKVRNFKEIKDGRFLNAGFAIIIIGGYSLFLILYLYTH